MMDSITLSNFRCFRDKQTVRLAPLTLLVGENSTGKTSFLALIRALSDIAFGHRVPDFKEDPYDLGSYREVAYKDDSNTPTDSFLAGFATHHTFKKSDLDDQPIYFETTFEKYGTRPIPIRQFYAQGEYSIEVTERGDDSPEIRLTTPRGCWKHDIQHNIKVMRAGSRLSFEDYLTPVFFYLRPRLHDDTIDDTDYEPLSDSPPLSEEEFETIQEIASRLDWPPWLRPFASAPVRSKPHRTYDPSRPTWDSEGYYIPMYLASLHSQDESAWKELLKKLERFGKSAGLFDELRVEQLGERDGRPFHIRIRKPGINGQRPRHNLIDVGYGISQVLPLITEILREESSNLFLLQQPEVHLHPSAQAALGSLFCEVAGRERQLIVETHSDYILDRIRMDIRDSVSSLRPDDISVLYFQHEGAHVRIHSLRFDEEGNVQGSPQGYRDFFMQETRRSLGL